MKDKALAIINRAISICRSRYYEFADAMNILQIKEMEGMDIELSTDGRYLFYNPDRIIKDYKACGIEFIVCQYMHIILHLLLDDPKTYRNTRAQKLFSSYADLRCEILLYHMSSSEKDEYRGYFDRCTDMGDYRTFTAFANGSEAFPESFFELRRDRSECVRVRNCKLKCDEHRFWLEMDEQAKEQWRRVRNELTGEVTGDEGKQPDTAGALFRAIKEMKKNEAEGQREQPGIAGVISQSGLYTARNVGSHSYMDILRDFICNGEKKKEDPDSIDKMIYLYGLDMYGDVALIEPDEEEEKENLGVIAIAIDTSGSCDGDVAEGFLGELSMMLGEISNKYCFDRIVIYQCDEYIQDIKTYSDVRDLPGYITKMQLFGFGGTSFTPVFESLQMMEKENGIKVSALIYLTDGYGEYPEKAPDFPVYFIMGKDSFYAVPNWIKVVDM